MKMLNTQFLLKKIKLELSKQFHKKQTHPLKRFDYFHKPDKDLDEANKIIASMLYN